MNKIINFSKKQFLRIGYCLKELTIFFTDGVVFFSICSVFIVISSILVNFVFNIVDFYTGTDIMNYLMIRIYEPTHSKYIFLYLFNYIVITGFIGFLFVGFLLFGMELIKKINSFFNIVVKDWRES